MATALDECFSRMVAAAKSEPYPLQERRDLWLEGLAQILHAHVAGLCTSVAADFGGRSSHETRSLEVLPSLEAIHFARRHLQHWMAPEPRKTSRWFLTGSASVRYEPLGVVGIIVPGTTRFT